MNVKKIGCGCLSVLALLGAVGGTYAYNKGWHSLAFNQELTPIRGAEVIPEDAIASLFINTENKNWQKLEELGIANLDTAYQQFESDLKREFTARKLDYEADIKPWIGNIMVSGIYDRQEPEESGILLIVGIENPLKAYSTYQKIKQSDSFKQTNYKGVGINVDNSSSSYQNYVALLGNKLAISDRENIVKAAIDVFKGEPSFADAPEVNKVLKQPLKIENELVKIYLPSYDELMLEGSRQGYTSEQIAKLIPIESFVGGIGTSKEQIEMQAFTDIKPNLNLVSPDPISNKLAKYYPADTVLFANGKDINLFWENLVEVAEQDPEFQRILDGVRTSARWITGLDLDKDVFSWMDGEFAMGLVADSDSASELGLDIGFTAIVESSDRDATENTLAILSNQVENQIGLKAQSKTIDKQTITNWSIPETGLNLSHGWVNNKLKIGIGNNLNDTWETRRVDSLEKNKKYARLRKELPKKAMGYYYLDVDGFISQIEQLQNYSLYSGEANSLITQIDTVAGVSTMSGENTMKTDLVIKFKESE